MADWMRCELQRRIRCDLRRERVSRFVASIEARMGSSRFPGKMLSPVAGKPALERVVERLREAEHLDGVIVATTTNHEDDAIEAWCDTNAVAVYRGSSDDVLGRVVGAQRAMDSDIVVEITGDALLTDASVVDLAISSYKLNECDVVSTSWKKSYPIGIDAQVFPLGLLESVAANVHDPAVREHVSLHFYENPQEYRIINLAAPRGHAAPSLRLTLDYPEDLEMMTRIFEALEPTFGASFGVGVVLSLIDENPHILGNTQELGIRPVRQ